MSVIFFALFAVVLAVAWGLALGYALRHDGRGKRLIREIEDWRAQEPV